MAVFKVVGSWEVFEENMTHKIFIRWRCNEDNYGNVPNMTSS